MEWEIINTEQLIPLCKFCNSTTTQMARFQSYTVGDYIYICTSCARYVKEAMNKWAGPDIPYVKAVGHIFDHKNIESLIEENRDKAIDHTLFPEVDPDDEMKESYPDMDSTINKKPSKRLL